MELSKLFDEKVINTARDLYQSNKVIIIESDKTSVEAIVYDDYFYKVSLIFNNSHSIIYMRASKDGYSDVCPYSKPYAAAVLYKLYKENEFGLTLNREHKEQIKTDRPNTDCITPKELSNMGCYYKLLDQITNYILRMQNYNTDATLSIFSSVVDEVFEYFDSIKNERERLVAVQLFLHIYLHLDFNFQQRKEIHCAIIDEANYRIYDILKNTQDTYTEFFYSSLINNDNKLKPYISDFNKFYHRAN